MLAVYLVPILFGLLANGASLSQAPPVGRVDSIVGPEDRAEFIEASGMFEPQENGYLFQGDVMLTEEQAMDILERKMYKETKYYWPRDKNKVLNINYLFGDDKVDKDKVKKALAEWEKRTCVKFTPIPAPPADKKAHLRFVDLKMCMSWLGTSHNKPDGGHEVSIMGTCSLTITIHEIGHALGFHHEQSRSDRDEYITLLTKNINPAGSWQFRKTESINHDIPYDYVSMMHYMSMYYSQEGGITMRVKDEKMQSVIGNRLNRLSFMDAKLFNTAYKCIEDWEEACPLLAKKCKNQGYVKKDSSSASCRCECPEGTIGIFCETLVQEYNTAIIEKYFPDTQNLMVFDGNEMTVSTPNYPKPHYGYKAFTKVIEALYCQQIHLEIKDLEMWDQEKNGVCFSQMLEIRTDPSVDDSGVILCQGKPWKGKTFISKSNKMILNYYAQVGGKKGWTATYKAVDVPGCSDE